MAAGYKCKSWLKDGSSSASATANYLLKLTKVQFRLQELKEQRARKADVSDVYVLTKLKTIVARCLQDVRPIVDKRGFPTGEFEFDSQGANKSLQLIGDYLHMWTPPGKQSAEQSVTHNTQINIYVPTNLREKELTLGQRGNGSAGAGSAVVEVGRSEAPTGGNGLRLPGNGHS